MHTLTRYLTILLLALLPCLTWAQNIENQQDLSWSVRTFQSDKGTQSILSFDGASFPDPVIPVPYFYQVLDNISHNLDYQVDLTQTDFVTLTEEEKKLLQGISFSDRIKIKTKKAIQAKQSFLQISFVPIRKNPTTGHLEKLTRFGLTTKVKPGLKEQSIKVRTYSPHSVLSTGKWVKIGVDSTAIYKITYQQLKEMGISQPENVRIYGYGGMLSKMNDAPYLDDLPVNSVWFQKGSDGIFNEGDFLLFYAQGPRSWKYNEDITEFVHKNHSFSDISCYFLTSDLGASPIPEMISATSGSYNKTVDQFDDYRVIDQDEENLLFSGRLWVGQKFDISTQYSFTFDFPNLVKEIPLKISAHVLARASSQSQFRFKSGEQTIGEIGLPGVSIGSFTAKYASEAEPSFDNFKASADKFSMNLEYLKSSASAKGWLDYLRINARRKLILEGNQMAFRDSESAGEGIISRFQLANTKASSVIFDVTNPQSIRQIIPQITGSTAEFILPTPNLKEFVACNPNGDFPTPKVIGEVANQNLHGLPQADLLIIAPKQFTGQASQLADYHRNQDHLSVLLADPEAIYNEFSSGVPDVAAIRNFAKMFYDRAQNQNNLPKYLLLFGDGSYDNKLESSSNTNQILTYQSENSLSPTESFVTDDFFGLLDDDEGEATGLLDLGIGRLPVNTQEEAQTVVQKILNYHTTSNLGSWRTKVCFIGDDEDNNIHMRDANLLAETVEKNHPQYRVKRIFLDAFPQETTSAGQAYPEVNRTISDQVNQGSLIMNYNGHGNESGLAHEHIVRIEDILNWQNQYRMPLFMTATCEFSRYDNYRKTSAGELILLRSGGGGIGLFTTTRLVYANLNFELNRNFYDYAFSSNPSGEPNRLGDLMRLTKRATGATINKRNFTLLGDPALILNYPQNNVETLTIKEVNNSQQTDTLKALSRITISGKLLDALGQDLTQFQGILYPTVYDKAAEKSTLGNDEEPFTYTEQDHILYKGKASVKNGQFSFTFMVPKDINYQFGSGKITYYASSSTADAAGYNNTIIVGGSNEEKINDNMGPKIDLYMNDEQFASGGITDSNPMLLAVVQDSSGINTVGTAIGHDIKAILDGNSDQTIRLNDHYESEMDNFQKGRITYQLSDLKEGEHQIQMKVWDNVNNSSEAELDFIVAENTELAIKHLLNYPNPFTTNTGFYFEHNKPHQELDVLIQILTVSGRLVKTIEISITPEGFRVGPIPWDGHDDFGNRIGKGVYFYRVKVRTEDGKVVNKFQKLVLLK